MRLFLLILPMLLVQPPLAADGLDDTPFRRHDPQSRVRLDDGPWAAFLQAHVRADAAGIHRVDYSSVSALEKKHLEAYVEMLAAVDPAVLARDEQMVFWINLYNALTVHTVLDHYPVESIRDITMPPASEGGGPWDAPLIEVLGQRLSLNDIEHRILRPIWADERIHYAVNCAALGCANLATAPFNPLDLEDQLEASASAFINHPRAVRLDGGRLHLSKLFLWYASDFGADREELLEHLVEYAETALANQLENFSGEIDYGYDWALNGF